MLPKEHTSTNSGECHEHKSIVVALLLFGNALHTLCVQWCSHMLEITDVDNTMRSLKKFEALLNGLV